MDYSQKLLYNYITKNNIKEPVIKEPESDKGFIGNEDVYNNLKDIFKKI